MIISERIFKIMEERGISQLEFSKQTGISQSTISDWKRKKTNPSADKIMTICKVLQVTPYEVLQDTVGDGDAPEMLYATKGTERYNFMLEFDQLDAKDRDRLSGYLTALKTMGV